MARSFAQAQDETRVAKGSSTRWPTASEEATAAISATAAATRNNEQKIRRHDVNEGVGFGFVIIELLVRYSPPRRVFLFGLRIDDRNDASKPKRIVVSTFYRKFNSEARTVANGDWSRLFDRESRCRTRWQKARRCNACIDASNDSRQRVGSRSSPLAFQAEADPP